MLDGGDESSMNRLPRHRFDCPYSPKCFMALAGPPRSHENGLPPRLFSHQSLERLSGKCSAGAVVAYAPCHGEQEIPHGPLRRPMALHRSASSGAHWARTPQATRLAADPRRRLLRAKERLPLAHATEGVPTVE